LPATPATAGQKIAQAFGVKGEGKVLEERVEKAHEKESEPLLSHPHTHPRPHPEPTHGEKIQKKVVHIPSEKEFEHEHVALTHEAEVPGEHVKHPKREHEHARHKIGHEKPLAKEAGPVTVTRAEHMPSAKEAGPPTHVSPLPEPTHERLIHVPLYPREHGDSSEIPSAPIEEHARHTPAHPSESVEYAATHPGVQTATHPHRAHLRVHPSPHPASLPHAVGTSEKIHVGEKEPVEEAPLHETHLEKHTEQTEVKPATQPLEHHAGVHDEDVVQK